MSEQPRRGAPVGRIAALACWSLCAALAAAQPARRKPHIGYVYPAGAQRGRTVEVVVGGQLLRGVTAARVSGAGVRAELVKYYKPLRAVRKEQRQALARRLRELIRRRWQAALRAGRVRGPLPAALRLPGGGRARVPERAAKMAKVALPQHPLLRDLEKKSLRELLHVVARLANARRYRQQNNPIAESVLLRVTVAANAPPGQRELRLITRLGLTNPLAFEVGALREVGELEWNDPGRPSPLPEPEPLALPVLVNGQILPSDVDRFRFAAKKGQRLVIEAHARRLLPFLPDAVPGWFQATLALYDPHGQRVAYDDDYRFDPDPLLCYEVPADGVYAVEIHDAIYRGREDFVYRLAISERPLITWTFPLGTRAGHGRYARIGGWNVTSGRLFLAARRGWRGIREKVWGHGTRLANPVPYDISALPSCTETEPGQRRAGAQRVRPPVVIDGRVQPAGEADTYAFAGRAGQPLVLEVLARRLQSPLDSVVWLLDPAGKVLAYSDDYQHKDGVLFTDAGLLTHHADSYLRTTLPADGTYLVRLADAQGHGGPEYAYRLRISPPQPDFAVWLTPSSINVPAGRAAVLTAHVVRRDGFDGPIELRLADAPPGFRLDGGRIPAGRNRIRMTLSAAARRQPEPVRLQLVARAEIAGRRVTRPVAPADDNMQAFLYRHLSPAQEMLAAVIGGRRFGSRVELLGDLPVRIPVGGSARVHFAVRRARIPSGLRFELMDDPPPGLTLANTLAGKDGLTLTLKADAKDARVGLADNLIVEVSAEIPARRRNSGQSGAKRRVQLGVLPAIPVEVVSAQVARRSGRPPG